MYLTIYKDCRQIWFLSYDERHKKHVAQLFPNCRSRIPAGGEVISNDSRIYVTLKQAVSCSHDLVSCSTYYYYYYYYYSSLSPLSRVFINIFLRQTMSLGNTVFQLFCQFYLWCLYRQFLRWHYCNFTLSLSKVCVQCLIWLFSVVPSLHGFLVCCLCIF